MVGQSQVRALTIQGAYRCQSRHEVSREQIISTFHACIIIMDEITRYHCTGTPTQSILSGGVLPSGVQLQEPPRGTC